MSTAHDLYQELSTLGVTIWQEGGQLRYRAPAGIVAPDLIDRLKANKPDLLVMLGEVRPLDRPQGSRKVWARSAANDPAPAKPKKSDFWDKAALVRGDALLFTNHLMACPTCYAPRDRYCAEGQRIKAAYEAKTVEAWH